MIQSNRLESLLTGKKSSIKPAGNLKLAHLKEDEFDVEIRTRLEKKNHRSYYGIIVIHSEEPEFYFESLDKSVEFIKRTKDNKLHGITTDTGFKKTNPQIEKYYFMSKLGLAPNKVETPTLRKATVRPLY